MDSVVLDGRYRLGALLGRGGMADVHRADDLVLGRPVAVKVFRFAGDESPERIDAEIRTLAALNNPGLVTLFDAKFDDRPYLVMELVDGPTLRAAGRSFEPDEVFRFASELAGTLAYVHSRGVVHRDIKPGNIILGSPRGTSGQYSTKLADFGIARFLDSARLTAHGATVGTAHYISPEQAVGRPVTPASDIYSLGLVLLECQTGRMVFGGDAVAAAVARLHRDPEVPTDWGPAWSALMTAMTSRDPRDRPTAAEVVTALEDANSIDTMILPVAQRSRSRSRPMVVVGLLALLGAVLISALLVTQGSDASDPVVQPSSAVVEPVVPSLVPAPAAVETTVVETTLVETTAAPAPVAVPAPAPAVVPAPVPEKGNNGNGNGNSGNGNSGNGNNGNGNGNGK